MEALKPNRFKKKTMDQDDYAVCSSFAEIKRNLDPASCYLIFETSAERGKTVGFEEILANLPPFEKEIDTHGIYYDDIHQRLMLIIKLSPKRKDQIINRIVDGRPPENMAFYIYGSRPE
jgi:hypothetical protein